MLQCFGSSLCAAKGTLLVGQYWLAWASVGMRRCGALWCVSNNVKLSGFLPNSYPTRTFKEALWCVTMRVPRTVSKSEYGPWVRALCGVAWSAVPTTINVASLLRGAHCRLWCQVCWPKHTACLVMVCCVPWFMVRTTVWAHPAHGASSYGFAAQRATFTQQHLPVVGASTIRAHPHLGGR